MEKIKTIIIDSNENVENLANDLKDQDNIELLGVFDNGTDALKEALVLRPQLVILDILVAGADGFEIIDSIKAGKPETKFIVVSSLNSQNIISKALDKGVDYFMLKPVNSATLIKRITEIFYNKLGVNTGIDKTIEEKITNIFLTVGIPAHIKGYQFLREAIKMAVVDPYIINSITKKLYPGIAELYDTTASKVERAIRHAIEVAWNKGKIENINDVFGLKVYDTHEKPTNGEFIALVADKMLLEKK